MPDYLPLTVSEHEYKLLLQGHNFLLIRDIGIGNFEVGQQFYAQLDQNGVNGRNYERKIKRSLNDPSINNKFLTVAPPRMYLKITNVVEAETQLHLTWKFVHRSVVEEVSGFISPNINKKPQPLAFNLWELTAFHNDWPFTIGRVIQKQAFLPGSLYYIQEETVTEKISGNWQYAIEAVKNPNRIYMPTPAKFMKADRARYFIEATSVKKSSKIWYVAFKKLHKSDVPR